MNIFYDLQESMPPEIFLAGFITVIFWTLFWKGLALWHSARRKQPKWFIALILINTVGILDIIYIFSIAKVKRSELFKS